MENDKKPFKKEWNKERHKLRMENDPEYKAQCAEYNRERLKEAKARGWVRKPPKKYADFTPEQKVKHLFQTTKYRKNNRDKLNAKRNVRLAERKANDPSFVEKQKESAKRWKPNEEQKQNRREKAKIWREQDRAKNPEKHKLQQLKYRLNNPEKRKQTCKNYRQKPQAKLYTKLRCRVRRIVENGLKNPKIGGLFNLVGCETECIIAHIQSQFTSEMTWDNWGKYWHLDHVLPIDLANGDYELAIKLSHYTNLRPLPKKENLHKKDKFIPSLWPENFPFPPEDFGLNRIIIPDLQEYSGMGLCAGLLSTCWI
jgi:hypothetical protein